MTTLTKEQVTFAKEELLNIIIANLEGDWRSINQLIATTMCEEFSDCELDEEDVYETLRYSLDCQTNLDYESDNLSFQATYD